MPLQNARCLQLEQGPQQGRVLNQVIILEHIARVCFYTQVMHFPLLAYSTRGQTSVMHIQVTSPK